jgi:hypothetical protein
MVGNATEPFMATGNDESLRQLLKDVATDLGVQPLAQAHSVGPGGVTDDHSPFMARAIPSVDVIPAGFSSTDYWHTTHDVPSKLDADFMGDVGRVTIGFVQAVSAA